MITTFSTIVSISMTDRKNGNRSDSSSATNCGNRSINKYNNNEKRWY